MKYDVVIIGAGPAGLNCAYHLQKSNKSILILEKNKTIGPKICGGGLTINCYSYLNPPKNIISHEFKSIKVHTDFQNRTLTYRKPLVKTCSRETLAKHQLKKLKNITIKKSTKVTKITKDYIIANNKKIFYNYLVGADGSSSIVRKYLNLKTNKLLMTVQYKVPKVFKDYEMFFDHKLLNPGYAWIIPHKNFTSIGCGSTNHKNLKERFHKWLKKHNINYKATQLEACPINYDYQGHEFDNIFLIGDAAGLASGLTGEGIYQALVSGEEIAKKILHPNYQTPKITRLLKYKKFHNKVVDKLAKNIFSLARIEIFALSLKNKKFVNRLIKAL